MSSDEYSLAEKLKAAVLGNLDDPHNLGIVQGVNMNTNWDEVS
jgi:hypothetical protein